MEQARKEYEEAFAAALKFPTSEAVTRLIAASDRVSRLMRHGMERRQR